MNIIVIEDDSYYLQWLIKTLQKELGYNVVAVADNYQDGLDHVENLKPQLVIADVHLKGEKTGLDLLEPLNQLSIPVIFISEDGSDSSYKKINNTEHLVFLVKPFHKYTLKSVIDLLHIRKMENIDKQFLINSGSLSNIVDINDIRWLESDRNYSTICTFEKRIVVRASMSNLLKILEDEKFIRIHKSYAVASKFIKSINYSKATLDIGSKSLPIGRTYRSKVKQLYSSKDPLKKLINQPS
ncbi:MAG: response regulator transcription factor [Saprospiraceae bacterium]